MRHFLYCGLSFSLFLATLPPLSAASWRPKMPSMPSLPSMPKMPSMPELPKASDMIPERDCLKRLASSAIDSTTGAVSGATDAISGAAEWVTTVAQAFRSFIQSIELSAGTEGLQAVVSENLTVSELSQLAWRVWKFEPDIDGLRKDMFEPMTEFVNGLCAYYQECAVLPPDQRVKKQVQIYGEFVVLIFEMTLKAHKLIPQTVIDIVPSALGTFIPIFSVKEAKSVDQLVTMVLRQFLTNAFSAITSRGLTIEQRFALLSFDMASIQATSQFAQDSGILDFTNSLDRLQEAYKSSPQPETNETQ